MASKTKKTKKTAKVAVKKKSAGGKTTTRIVKKAAKAVKAAAKPLMKKSSSLAATPAKSVKPLPANFLQPLEDRIVVEPEGVSETTPGGIIIPTTVSGERPNRGHVLAAGRGKRNKKGALRPLDVKAGDTVLFSDYAGTKITVEGRELLILREEDVLGIAT